MYKDNPNYKKPLDGDIRIWHYIRYGDFVKMLEKKALYFRRMDLMQQSSVPEYVIPSNILEKYASDPLVNKLLKKRNEIGENGTFLAPKIIRQNYFVHPWTMSNDKKDRDWMYGSYTYNHPDEAIVIESTYKCLTSSFMQQDPKEVYVGVVKYFDRKNYPLEAILQPSTHRPDEKKHERELRAVTMNNEKESNIAEILELPIVSDQCKEIQISFDKLIKKVFVSPSFDKSLVNDVKKMVEKYIGDVFCGVLP